MQPDARQNDPGLVEAKKQFNETLAQHMERLIGTSKGIGDLPLNLATISCLVLLAERESEIEAAPSDPPERYTEDTFLHDLAQVGVDSREELETTIQDITDKGYVDIAADGRFLAKKPALSMARLLDQTLPGMPGMNLVANLIQTMDDVLSGRKDLGFAIGQFGQNENCEAPSEGETQEILPESDSDERGPAEAVTTADGKAEEISSEHPMPSPMSESSEQEEGSPEESEADESGTQEAAGEEVPRTDHNLGEMEFARRDRDSVITDESLEERIAAFARDLAMPCPLCSTGQVENKQTAEGKAFYSCSNKDCFFVSWGKPYHLACPWCGNPFLIESTDSSGNEIFRCPRATCHYQQGLPRKTARSPFDQLISTRRKPSGSPVTLQRPGRKKKVVRRRVVRRKR